jgi:hypothetical protein
MGISDLFTNHVRRRVEKLDWVLHDRGMLGREAWERFAVTLGPVIFYRERSTRGRPYEQYRLDGESIVCERVTPNARSSGPPHAKHLQSWTVDEFLIANVFPQAKASLQQMLRERHAKRP